MRDSPQGMKIKRLEIAGFKSFAERTVFHFPPGITAIVGPNGCGKSNIVDAIKWVLGEQGVKPLRSKSMGDVIFNGSETRKPLGMAEVTITFSNEDGTAPPRYREFSEISVRRRLYRSGESEYSINNTTCRLKDIIDLFMDTGIGSRSYSIVEQGHIDWLINARPEERRFIFEEAAGIHKYRVRKDEALKKLEATKANLLRVQDIIHEVNRQIGSIERQARKARRYRETREAIKEIERSLIALELQGFRRERNNLSSRIRDLRNALSSATATMNRLEGLEEEKRLQVLEVEGALKALHGRMGKVEGKVKDLERSIDIIRIKMENLHRERDRLKEEGKGLEAKRKGLWEKKERLKEEREGLTGELSRLREETEGMERELSDLRERIHPLEKVIEERRKEVLKGLTTLTSINNEISYCLEEEKRLKREAARRGEERRQVEGMIAEKEREGQTLKATIQEVEGDRKGLEERLEEALERLKALRSARDAKEKELDRVKEGLASTTTRVRTLEESIASEVQIPSRFVKEKTYGLLADVVTTEERFEKALEAILGERLKGLLVEDHTAGMRMLKEVKGKGGRYSFIPVKARMNGDMDGDAGYGIPLVERVSAQEGCEGMVKALLRNVIFVQDLEEALGILDSGDLSKTIVTEDGDIIEPTGVVTGGSHNTPDRGMIKKRRELRELRAEEVLLKERERDLKEGVERIINEEKALTERVEELRGSIHALEIKVVTLKNRERALKAETDELRRKVEILSMEMEELERDIHTSLKKREDLLTEKARTEKDVEGWKALMEREEQRLKELLKRKEGIEGQLNSKRVRMASLSERISGLSSSIGSLERTLKEVEERITHGRKRLQAIEGEVKGLSSSLKEKEEILTETMAEHERLKGEVSSLEGRYSRMLQEIKDLEGSVRSKRKEVRDLEEKERDLTFALREVDLKIEGLLARAREMYSIDEEDLLSKEVKGEREEMERRLESLRKRLQSMGEVNLAAIEELKELEERRGFLTSQKEDLERSMESLNRAIQRINRVSRKRFLKTLEEVNRGFQDIYSRFFGGGKAAVEMVNEDDPLGTGIEIVAQPKGKRLQSITLLSGGEKALTVISLIFSLFLVRPSPFFLLDEADAPLDETNTVRFVGLIKELASKSQFILITHNKKTMEMADTLYGITMAEPGVSKILSVSLVEEDHQGRVA